MDELQSVHQIVIATHGLQSYLQSDFMVDVHDNMGVSNELAAEYLRVRLLMHHSPQYSHTGTVNAAHYC